MKSLTTFFLTVFILIELSNTLSFAQSAKDERMWSVFRPRQTQFVKTKINNQWIPVEQTNKYYKFGSGIIVSPNFRPHPNPNATQSEMSIDVHPSNSNIIFCSANASDWPVTMLYGTGVYWSLDGSITWTGYDIPPFGYNWGDPVSIIGANGYFYENFITLPSGQAVAISTNNGTDWTTYQIAPNPGQMADKNHFMVDKTTGSPYQNRAYCSWTDYGGTYNNEVVLRYSTDFCQTWTSSINISGTLTPLGSSFAQGTNIQTGPNGEVYVTYAIYDANWTDGEDAIGFSKSTDGGATWTHIRAYDHENFGIRPHLANKDGIRVNSFPCMAVDKSGGQYDGSIYMCWAQRSVAPAGNDPDIVLVKSTDGGANWFTPVKVNDDVLNNGKDQYFPWCTIDQSTGQLLLVFYDSRDVPNDQAEVFMASSTDGGNTFYNFKVSDQSHTPTPIQGAPSGYAGDYIGIAALDSIAYPFWMDNRTGYYQGWMAKVELDTIVPVELTSFTAIAQTDYVELNWTTATEINNLGFEIERKIINDTDREWIKIGFKEGYGTTTEPKEYSFVDDISDFNATSMAYRLKQIDFDGSYEYSEELLIETLAPVNFVLEQNYPNPFNPTTTIKYEVPERSLITLKVYDILGKEVATLVNEEKSIGSFEVEFDATSLSTGVSAKGGYASGVYFYRLQAVPSGRQAGSFIETKKMVLLR